MSEPIHSASERTQRVIDFRTLLPWFLGIVVAVSWGLISMYFSVNNLIKTVEDLRTDVKAGNNSVVAVAGELALLKYRLANAEVNIERVTETVKKGGEK